MIDLPALSVIHFQHSPLFHRSLSPRWVLFRNEMIDLHGKSQKRDETFLQKIVLEPVFFKKRRKHILYIVWRDGHLSKYPSIKTIKKKTCQWIWFWKWMHLHAARNENATCSFGGLAASPPPPSLPIAIQTFLHTRPTVVSTGGVFFLSGWAL